MTNNKRFYLKLIATLLFPTLGLQACANNQPATLSASAQTDQMANDPIYQFINSTSSGQPKNPTDPLSYNDAAWPGNINYQENKIEFASPRALGKLYKKWHSGTYEPISIAHFGDSHIQSGWQIAAIREVLHKTHPQGGRGMIFPYAIAKTYSQEDYTSTFTGQWRTSNSIHQPPKIPLGISGFVAVTNSNAFGFNFKFHKNKPEIGSVKATVYLKAINGSYAVTASNGLITQTQLVENKTGNPTQKITFELPDSMKDLNFAITKTNGDGASFELHGVELSNLHTKGLTYHNLGVGGANYKSILQQKLFEEQFTGFPADLIVLDWGTNDILYSNTVSSDMESIIRRTIQKVRNIKPDAAILLTTPQEARYKGKPVTATKDLAALIRRIAKEENCLLYDWYAVSGQSDSVHVWKNAGYASKDTIHLNGKGYRIRGTMLAHALLDVLR